MLAALFPSRGSLYQAACDAQLAKVDTAGEQAAWNLGTSVAAQVLSSRAADGRETVLAPFGFGGSLEGEFRNLAAPPPGAQLPPNPVNYVRPHVRPFSLDDASQFRTDPPPAPGSTQYLADLAETRALGDAGSTVRTEAQTENAKFHTMPPPLFWMDNLQQFATSRPTLVENARLMAALWVAQSDAVTSCFDSKYHYLAWRPITAIRYTWPDSAWTPVVGTPNHPEYPAAHACVSGATAEVLGQVFGTKKLHFTFHTSVATVKDGYKDQRYVSTDNFVNTIQEARIVGGMHFRSATVAGDVLGMKVAKQLMREHFQPVR